jgi:hypothetical protein
MILNYDLRVQLSVTEAHDSNFPTVPRYNSSIILESCHSVGKAAYSARIGPARPLPKVGELSGSLPRGVCNLHYNHPRSR